MPVPLLGGQQGADTQRLMRGEAAVSSHDIYMWHKSIQTSYKIVYNLIKNVVCFYNELPVLTLILKYIHICHYSSMKHHYSNINT